MPSRSITDQDVLRYIHRSTDDELAIPSLENIGGEGDYVDIYKGEIVVNYSEAKPGLYIRAGRGTDESSITDKLVRIGNVIVSDLEPYAETNEVNPEGLLWHNTRNNHLFLNVKGIWEQITNSDATDTLKGVVRFATEAEVIIGYEPAAVLTPQMLKRWQEYYEYIPRKRGAAVVYVNTYIGDDSIENDGSDSYYPFLTVERALLETTHRDVKTIILSAGEYVVDNSPGVLESRFISKPFYKDEDGLDVGPINPVSLNATVLEVDITGDKGTIVVEDTLAETLYKNQQVFFDQDGTLIGHALINTSGDIVASNPIPFRNLKGTIKVGSELRIAGLSSCNSSTGGLILAKPCVIKSEGVSTIRPRYTAKYVKGENVARSYLFKVGQSCVLENLVFADGLIEANHFMYSAITNATTKDLNIEEGYLKKVAKALDQEITVETSYLNKERGTWLRVSSCTLDSHFGASLLTLFESPYSGVKEIILDNLAAIVTQEDLDAYAEESDPTTPIEQRSLLPELESWVVKVESGEYLILFNGGYSRDVPHFSIVAEGNTTTVNVGNHFLVGVQ